MKNTLTLCMFILISTNAFTQTKSSSPKPPGKQEIKRKADQTPNKPESSTQISKFSMSMIAGDRLDPGYSGPLINQVVEEIEKLTSLKKGEFESTTEYNSRKSAALAQKFLGELSIDDTFAFIAPVTAKRNISEPFRYDFDADTQELQIFVTPRSFQPDETSELVYKAKRYADSDQFDLYFKLDSKTNYRASNAYGAAVSVERTIMSSAGVLADSNSFQKFGNERQRATPSTAVSIKMNSSKAQRDVPRLKALLVVKAVEPYIVKNDLYAEATRSSPTEIFIGSKYLLARILGVLFFSEATGEILARMPENFGKS